LSCYVNIKFYLYLWEQNKLKGYIFIELYKLDKAHIIEIYVNLELL